MATDPFVMGFIFGFLPGIAMIYLSLKGYEGFFDEKRLFKCFFVGIVAGLVMAVFFMLTSGVGGAGPWGPVLFFYGFGILEALVLAAILNSKRFRARRDTPYYGVAVGLGVGAMLVTFLVTIGAVGLGRELTQLIGFLLMGTFLLAYLVAHVFIGGWVGRVAFEKGTFRFVWQAGLVSGTFLAGFFLLLQITIVGVVAPFAALAFALWLLRAVRTKVLDRLVPTEILREMDLHNRRMARRAQREASTANDSDLGEAPKDAAPNEAPPGPGPGPS